jgi:LysR family nitrogen assimilation transcriptional regulator
VSLRAAEAPRWRQARRLPISSTRGRQQGLSISIQEAFSDELLDMVHAGKLDCALCFVAPEQAVGLRVVPLIEEDLYAVGRPETFGNAKSETISFAAMAQLPLVLDSAHQTGRRLIDGVAQRLGIRLDTVAAASVTVKRELMSRTGLCTVVPFGLYAAEIATGQLEARRVTDPPISRTLALAHPVGNDPNIARIATMLEKLVRTQRHGRSAHGS